MGILATMSISFGGGSFLVPAGAVIGCVGSGARAFLKTAGGNHYGPFDKFSGEPVGVIAVDHALDVLDLVSRVREERSLEAARRRGASVLLASSDHSLLARMCDEVWWFDGTARRAAGDPREVLPEFQRALLAESDRNAPSEFLPALRRGDGRATLLGVETAGVWQSGQDARVVVRVQFQSAVESPVIGIMIRTRIGMEVYGTNTELEDLRLGPYAGGEEIQVSFVFRCDLCPQHYTITAASHDPDGVWHDWVEDAVAVAVSDTRYTAGVANLRARVEVR